MERHLRLAERQGLLQGQFLSPVQVEALNILIDLDDFTKYRAEQYQFMRSLMIRPEYRPQDLFPDHFKGGETTTEEVEGDDVEYDYSSVDWKGPSDVDEEELAKILGLLADAHGKVDMEQTESMVAKDWV